MDSAVLVDSCFSPPFFLVVAVSVVLWFSVRPCGFWCVGSCVRGWVLGFCVWVGRAS